MKERKNRYNVYQALEIDYDRILSDLEILIKKESEEPKNFHNLDLKLDKSHDYSMGNSKSARKSNDIPISNSNSGNKIANNKQDNA